MMTMVSPEYLSEAEIKTEKIRSAIEYGRGFGHSESDIGWRRDGVKYPNINSHE